MIFDRISAVKSYIKANMEQAKYSVEIREACGFGLREVQGVPAIFEDFANAEVERMAEMEHGRWNVERLLDGWRNGKVRSSKRRSMTARFPGLNCQKR